MSEARYFEQPALWGASTASGPHSRRIEETVALLPPSIESLGDIGAGDGALTDALARARPDVLCVSVERSLAALAHVGGHVAAGSVDALPLRTASLDCLAICEVIEHLPVGVYERTLDDLGRVARRWVLITVPHDEDRRRSSITCRTCGCRFNRFQHLRSFRAADMEGVVPGFRTVTVTELGPLGVWYPWWAAAAAERLGLVRRAGAPLCPQCGSGQRPSETDNPDPSLAPKRWLPRSRKRVWLAALYERE